MKNIEKTIERSLVVSNRLAIMKIAIIYGLLIALLVWIFVGMGMIKPFIDNYFGIG